MKEYCADVLVVQDGKNGSFHSYMTMEEANRIVDIGLLNAGKVLLKEYPQRIIPKSLKEGRSQIVDIQVRLDPNVVYVLN